MVAEMLQLIDWTQPSLYLSAACIIFNPLAWNIVARREYRGKFISKRIGAL